MSPWWHIHTLCTHVHVQPTAKRRNEWNVRVGWNNEYVKEWHIKYNERERCSFYYNDVFLCVRKEIGSIENYARSLFRSLLHIPYFFFFRWISFSSVHISVVRLNFTINERTVWRVYTKCQPAHDFLLMHAINISHFIQRILAPHGGIMTAVVVMVIIIFFFTRSFHFDAFNHLWTNKIYKESWGRAHAAVTHKSLLINISVCVCARWNIAMRKEFWQITKYMRMNL